MRAHDVRRLKICAGCNTPDLNLIKSNDGKHYHGRCLVKRAGLDLLAALPESERNKFTIADMRATDITLDELIALREAPAPLKGTLANDRMIGLRATADGDLALSINGHEIVLTTEEALRLGELLQRARVCPLCDKLMVLERDGRFPEHGCSITIAVSQKPTTLTQAPKHTPRKALPERR